MRFSVVTLVLCLSVGAVFADVAHVKAAKAKLIGRLAGKHHKRGILSHVPPFKLGHDIPIVTHSVLKPLVVTYPPTASVAAVKIPVAGPHPVPVGHKVPGLPHPHYGLKFPHTKFVAKPDHHFHHHHHHVAPKPIIPVVPAHVPASPVTHVAPIIPAPAPTIVTHAAPPPPQPVAIPTSVIAQPLPVPAPPVPVIPNHFHLRPLLPSAGIAFPPGPVFPPPVLPAPVLPSQPFPYVIRPGGSVQTSFFATYPRYPLINSYQAPLIPFAASAPTVPTVPQVLLERPHVHSLAHPALVPQGVIEHSHNVLLEQTPTHLHPTQIGPEPSIHLHHNEAVAPQPHFHLHPNEPVAPPPHFHLHHNEAVAPQPQFHLHPTQIVPEAHAPLQPTQATVHVDNNGWSPVVTSAQPHDIAATHDAHYPQTHFTQEQGTQVYEQHTENQFHDYQHQLQHHIQQQIEQAQYEQSLHNQQQQPAPEYGVPQQPGPEYSQPNEYSQNGQNVGQNQQDYAQHNFLQPGQDFGQHGQDFAQHEQDFSQQGQDFSQQGQDFSQYAQDFSQHGQDFNQNNYNVGNLGQEYGVPQQQGVEGRSSDDNDNQQYHNHIPLGLQPPIDRPLDHFQ